MLHKGRHSKHIFNIFDNFRIYFATTLALGKNKFWIKIFEARQKIALRILVADNFVCFNNLNNEAINNNEMK